MLTIQFEFILFFHTGLTLLFPVPFSICGSTSEVLLLKRLFGILMEIVLQEEFGQNYHINSI